MRQNLPVTGIEYEIDADQSIVTRTDLKSYITYANPYFVEVSGFNEAELIGAPQNIVRHPDMPPAAFADLWQTIRAGLPWRGLVKNRRKNGDFYWVLANVTPIIESGKTVGYLSVRTKPSRADVELANRLYQRERERPGSLIMRQGRLFKSRWHRRLAAILEAPLSLRLGFTFALLLIAIAVLGWGVWAADEVARMGLRPWLAGFAASVFTAVCGLWLYIATQIVRPINDAVRMAQCIAGGDLGAGLATERSDEIGQLLRALSQTNVNLHSIVGDIKHNFGKMLSATRQIAIGNTNLSARTDSQAASLEETAASIEEITSAVKQNAEHTSDGHAMAHRALAAAEKGGDIVAQVVDTITEINASSQKIAEIVGIINGIAHQTNLLALNAAVEAARAGDTGRGFAVVANEVRDLAQRSATAASEIKELIEQSTEKVNAGTVLVKSAGSAMEEILRSIRSVSDLMSQIASASGEQGSGIDQVNTAIAHLDEMTQKNAALVEKAAASTRSLEQQGGKLMEALALFKLNRGRGAFRPLPKDDAEGRPVASVDRRAAAARRAA